jgi:hypothetical protein
MSNVFFRAYLVIFALLAQNLFSKIIEGLSDAVLNVNNEKIAVKVFSTTDINFQRFFK